MFGETQNPRSAYLQQNIRLQANHRTILMHCWRLSGDKVKEAAAPGDTVNPVMLYLLTWGRLKGTSNSTCLKLNSSPSPHQNKPDSSLYSPISGMASPSI